MEIISVFFQYEFLQNAFLIGIMIGFLAPILGVFLVVRRLSLIADALSHITLSGIAASLLLGKYFVSFASLNPLYLGIAFSVGGALLIERLRSVYKSFQELSIPIMLSGGVGLGVVFISFADGFNTDLLNYLFGSVIAVTKSDLLTISVITILVSLLLVVFYKELFFLSFDEEQAIVSGVNKKVVHFIFIIMVALVIASSMRIVGILLVSSLMSLPVAASMRVAKGFKQMFIYSVLFGELSVIVGIISAYHLDIAPGGTIVVTAVLILLITIIFKRKS